jgi:cytochrome b pre-mRNA-processing protein 3
VQAPHSKTPVAMGIAQKLRERAPLMTETYVAYGATRDLIKECSRPGDYKIPQSLERKGEIPVDDNGVHLGVGEGWWYESMILSTLYLNTAS